MPECPSSASCIAGYVAVDTTRIAPGEYTFVEQGTRVALTVTLDDHPRSTMTHWSLPVEPA